MAVNGVLYSYKVDYSFPFQIQTESFEVESLIRSFVADVIYFEWE